MSETPFQSWAVVEVMGHVTYAGFVTAETVAGAAMLRVDVPEVEGRTAFTKYIATSALYGISPCTEATARARAAHLKAVPFASWDVEQQVMQSLQSRGLLLEQKAPYEEEEDEW